MTRAGIRENGRPFAKEIINIARIPKPILAAKTSNGTFKI